MAQEWLRSAQGDLETIEEIRDNNNLTHVAAFHAQQCIEKSLKAVLEFQEKDVPKSHSVLQLAGKVENVLCIEDKDTLDELDKLYIDSRYPGDFGLLPNGKPTPKKAQVFYEYAKNIYEKVSAVIL